MKPDKMTKDPIQTLYRVVHYMERAALALSVLLLTGTAGYLTIHAWA
ncbi:hypothetical protein C7445_10592 [Alicyclobacillus sacchari]|uniref:Uncharacterized protein n=1 Tax=Alicyclobacillus sacchari TaxID=392010 RepID=A0A4R8LQW7_9BACL|nr:hypothetical protein [Alicyclobacillus sacchari]TDY47913.1 hypothetical protein C7445_10592 [Alicyclobacillus sacchari]